MNFNVFPRAHVYFLAVLVLVALLMTGLTACKSDSAAPRLLVTYATLKVIERGDTPTAQIERAQKIRSIATNAKAVAQSESVTLALLQGTVGSELDKLSLSAADRFLADELVRQVLLELEQRVGTAVLSPEQRFRVGTVLDWVLQATAAYAGG